MIIDDATVSFLDSEYQGGVFQQKLLLGKQQDHFRSRWHRLPSFVSSCDFRGMDGGDGGCRGRERGRFATAARGESIRLSLLRNIHRLRFILHAQSFYWSDHRQL